MGDRPDERQAFEIEEGRKPVGPGQPKASTSFDVGHLDFGHYAGRSIEELAVVDPDYLRWLERHPSGARYRKEIQRVFAIAARLTDGNR